MKQIVIHRFKSMPWGVFGALLVNEIPVCWTLEDEWLDNASNKSCIPYGHYICTPWKSHKFGDTWIINDVPDRSAILFHAGNTIKDTQGCILVGTEPSAANLYQSKKALLKFLAILAGETEAELTIYGPML